MHIGIIMDGNGRWATQRGLPRLRGHKQGVQTVKDVIRACPSLGVDTVTLFAFAIANWKRDKEEVDGLWLLFRIFIEQDLAELTKQGVKVIVIGNREGLPSSILDAVETVEARSRENTQFLLQVALNYDGVDEVVRLIRQTMTNGVSADAVTPAYVRDHLDTHSGNDPDIVIRTGMPTPNEGMGVWRSSAFLPLQSAQSVCVSTDVLWPDFTRDDLIKIIEFADPNARLFGGQRKVATSAA